MQTMPKHIFLPIIDSSSLYSTIYMRSRQVYAESVSVVTSGHVTKMAVTPFDPQFLKTPGNTQTWRLYLLYNRSYLRLKFHIAGIGNFAYFWRKIVENIKIFRSYRTSDDPDNSETHFLVHYRQFQLVCCRSYTHSRCCITPNRLVWSLPVTWQRWRSHHSIRSFRKTPVIRKLDVSIFYRIGVIAHWRFTLRE